MEEEGLHGNEASRTPYFSGWLFERSREQWGNRDTVKPVLVATCIQRPPVLRGHSVMSQRCLHQSSQLSLILSESHSFHCNLTLSLLGPSISLIFAQSHSNLAHFQQQIMSVVNYTSPSSKIYFQAPVAPQFAKKIHKFSSILIFKV